MATDVLNYQNFDLLIDQTGDDYRAYVLDSPAGQLARGPTHFKLPFSPAELANSIELIGGAVRHLHAYKLGLQDDADHAQALDPKTFGLRLYGAVFGQGIEVRLRISLATVQKQGTGLRIRLRLTGAPELADLPWEYLFDPDNNRFFVLSKQTPIVRYLDLPEEEKPLAVEPPLHVLAVIPDPSDVSPKLKVEEEWMRLQSALDDLESRKLVRLERLEKATLTHLQTRLRQTDAVHILHFIGHGTFDLTSQTGELILEDETGRGQPASAQALGTLLHDHRPLRLAFLNACKGARAARKDMFAGTAQHLVRQGTPAVIAMQFEVTDKAAITLAHEFYRALSDGYPIEASLAEARKALSNQDSAMEWGTPVLFTRSADNRLFVQPVVSVDSASAHRHHEPKTVIDSPSSWDLLAYGFDYDPFAYIHAERTPPEILEQTFVPHRDFDEKVMDFSNSLALIAPSGGGKTSGRLRLETKLKQRLSETLNGNLPENFPRKPFLVSYCNFESIVKRLPNKDLPDHKQFLLAAIAESIYEFTQQYSGHFLKVEASQRHWLWRFMKSYLIDGESVEDRLELNDNFELVQDFNNVTNPRPPFNSGGTMEGVLKGIPTRLQKLGFDSIFILVDGLDGYSETQQESNIELIVKPFLNNSLLSLRNIIWRFFLPAILEKSIVDSACYQTQRLRLGNIQWEEKNLVDFLKLRLEHASNRKVPSLTSLMAQDWSIKEKQLDLDAELAKLALNNQEQGSPRALLKLTGILLGSICKTPPVITLDDWLDFNRAVGKS